MKILRNRFKNKLNIRTEKDFPKKGIEFIDITPLFLQKETLKEMSKMFVKEIKPLTRGWNSKALDKEYAPQEWPHKYSGRFLYSFNDSIYDMALSGSSKPVVKPLISSPSLSSLAVAS